MYTQLTTSANYCIDNNYIKTAFENLEFLNECINGSSLQARCQSVSATESARLTRTLGPEACIPLQIPDPLISPTAFSPLPARKVLIIDFVVGYDPV